MRASALRMASSIARSVRRRPPNRGEGRGGKMGNNHSRPPGTGVNGADGGTRAGRAVSAEPHCQPPGASLYSCPAGTWGASGRAVRPGARMRAQSYGRFAMKAAKMLLGLALVFGLVLIARADDKGAE